MFIEAKGMFAEIVACEDNSVLARVDLGAARVVATAPTGADSDVMAVDPGLALLYVAAESEDLVIFDIGKPGLVTVDREHPGDHAHSVARRSVDAPGLLYPAP